MDRHARRTGQRRHQSRGSGYLVEQAYTEGSFVKKGQLLFQIDPRPFQAALDQAQGQLAQAEGQLEQARAQLAAGAKRR